MPNPASQLGRIQSIDVEISSIVDEGVSLKKDADAAREASTAADVLLAEAEETLASLTAEKSEIEEKVRLNTEKIEKDEKRLGEITNDKQFKALSKEISDAGKAKKLLSMEHVSIGEKISAAGDELNTKKDAAGSAEAEVARVDGAVAEKEEQWAASIEKKKAQKEKAAAEISPSLLKKYETIKSRRGGVAVVKAKDETCQGCYMNIPPQLYLQLVRGIEEVQICPHCHRILYYDTAESAGSDATNAS